MTERDPREKNLPKWAQSLLAQERYRADRAEYQLEQHRRQVEPTPIWYGDLQNPIYVPAPFGYQSVHFNTKGEASRNTFDRIEVAYDKGKIRVSSTMAVSIYPVASNVVEVALRD